MDKLECKVKILKNKQQDNNGRKRKKWLRLYQKKKNVWQWGVGIQRGLDLCAGDDDDDDDDDDDAGFVRRPSKDIY